MDSTHIVTKADLPNIVEALLTYCRLHRGEGATVVALHGDLGAGKTTVVQEIGTCLGVTEQITSPTFTIMKGYETTDNDFTRLIHMDAYRIDALDELGPLHFSELLRSPQTLFCIEWAERVKDALPEKIINLTIEVVSEDTRNIRISTS